jgi:hypothetical protein
MPSSFENQKALRLIITLGTGTFGASSANQITIQGFRAVVDVDKGGGAMFAHLNAQVFGVSQQDMNQITTLQYQALTTIPNTIAVWAIDGNQETLIFEGNLVNAWGNYQGMPEVFLQLEAQAGYINKLTPIAPSSYQGSADVATIFQSLAKTMGYTFENNLITPVPLSNPCFTGTAIDQADKAGKAAGIYWGIDNSVLWIAPPNTARPTGKVIPEVDPESGLIGYPSFDGQGYITFSCVFNPAIKFLGKVKLVTSIPKASGQWTVVGVAHKLESEKADGAWFSTVRVTSNGFVPTS